MMNIKNEKNALRAEYRKRRAELDAAKKSIRNAYRQLEDSPLALESFYFGRTLFGVDATATDCRTAFEKISRDDVINAAAGLTLDTVYFLNGTLAGEEETVDGDACEFDE